MDVKIREKNTNLIVEAKILPALKKDLSLVKDGWLFNWKEFFKKGYCYKLILKDKPANIQALVTFSTTSYGLLYMEQVEASPENKGKNGKYEAVGALIAYCCKLSFEIKEPYKGYLGFTSKTNLIEFYKSKYRAKLISNQRMCIEPSDSSKLISYYLRGEKNEEN
jgi:hypothetical protein